MAANVVIPASGTGDSTPIVEAIYNSSTAGFDGSKRQVVSVAGITVALQSTLTNSTTAYTAGQCVGGFSTFASAVRSQNGIYSGKLQNVALVCKSAQTAVEMDLYIFKSTLSTASIFTDQTTPSIAAADMHYLIGRVPLVDIDTTISTAFTMWQAGNLMLPFNLGSITSIYGSLVTRGTPTFATTGDLIISLGILND